MRTLSLLIILLVFVLAACGGEEQQGVELQPVGAVVQGSPATASPADGQPAAPTLAGRLLYRKGGQFELYDFKTGQTTAFESTRATSPAFMTHDKKMGVFTMQAGDFGVIDLVANSLQFVDNRGDFPNALGISPDGLWLAATTGNITQRLQLLSTSGGVSRGIAASGNATYQWAWTTDSRLVWWEVQDNPVMMVADPATGDSVPLDDPRVELTVPYPLETSPDGALTASVPVTQAGSEECFDSYIELFRGRPSAHEMNWRGETVWTEPGLVASSPHWLDSDTLLYLQLGTGECGNVAGEPVRQIMLFDLAEQLPRPRPVAGPLGNAGDVSDFLQQGKLYTHLYSASPDGQSVAWISGGYDTHETVINVTDIATGSTTPVVRFATADAYDAADFIENFMIRQVVWVE